jgi:tRNA-dihydrouridine synthase B
MRVYLAPMAGVTDWAFRTVCRELAPDIYTTTEMVSAKALCYQDKKSVTLLRLESLPSGAPPRRAAQIFGSDPDCMAEGARRALEISGADVIDINMGCPTPKIVNNGDGSALMRDLTKAQAVAKAVAGAVDSPVTVKMRLGWDSGSKNAAELAARLEDAGVSQLCVHGRTRKQMYSGNADWYAIAEVVKAVSIPVLANGDIFSLKDMERCLKITGAAGGMIGRAAMGNPFVFTGEDPSVARRLDVAERHFALLSEDKGERAACLEMRKHFAWYLRGLAYASLYKKDLSVIATAEDFFRCVKRVRREHDG